MSTEKKVRFAVELEEFIEQNEIEVASDSDSDDKENEVEERVVEEVDRSKRPPVWKYVEGPVAANDAALAYLRAPFPQRLKAKTLAKKRVAKRIQKAKAPVKPVQKMEKVPKIRNTWNSTPYALPPPGDFSMAYMARKKLEELEEKTGLSKRTTRDSFCIACLDFQLKGGHCSNEHDVNADRFQGFWLREFTHDEKLTKATVVADLKAMANMDV